MRITNDDNNFESINEVTLLLRRNEAEEMMGKIKYLLDGNDLRDHVHISESDLSREITIAIYDENNLEGLHEKAIEAIRKK